MFAPFKRANGRIRYIAEFLLAAGTEVDAAANVYGGGCTALGLVATSEPPRLAGVQQDVMDVLLKHGARLDNDGLAGNRHTLVYACLANGQPHAAEYLANREAPLNLASAAGLGRVDVVKECFDRYGRLRADVTESQLVDAFARGRLNHPVRPAEVCSTSGGWRKEK